MYRKLRTDVGFKNNVRLDFIKGFRLQVLLKGFSKSVPTMVTLIRIN